MFPTAHNKDLAKKPRRKGIQNAISEQFSASGGRRAISGFRRPPRNHGEKGSKTQFRCHFRPRAAEVQFPASGSRPKEGPERPRKFHRSHFSCPDPRAMLGRQKWRHLYGDGGMRGAFK